MHEAAATNPANQPPTSPGDKVNVLLIGGGGREHALAWKLKQSPRLGKLWTTNPENPGIAALASPIETEIDWKRPYLMQRFCTKNDIGLVVIGPEEPLALGAADGLALDVSGNPAGRAIFGPGRDGAKLEADKAWARQLLRGAAVPMAEGRVFTDAEGAKNYLASRESPQVVKASGLAKGKGVILPANLEEAIQAVDRIMVKREFGDAGNTVVIEERLKGREASLLALVDGRTMFVLEPCLDHKRLGDGDTGPNTGGMGVICPGGVTDEAMTARVEREILVPTLDAMRRDGIDFRGVLYCGLMFTPAGPKVLEYNVRFGDPECQALMARFDADVLSVMLATGMRKLDQVQIAWSPKASCCVVLASKGYPEKPEKGKRISGLEEAAAVEGVQVFHAGTRRESGGEIVTAGGRVLNVVGVGESAEEARRRAYQACELIKFEGKTYRTDIGANIGATAVG
ncbi:MAG: phosphoribosylamine--glycine ligase [Phycisphaerales bacterium]|nr:phosphoribosylamine--glycine ligase [Phycisphaerales bacterium]